MKTIEIRRHSIRSGQNLSQNGVSLARMIGDEIGPFDRVITSPIPRAVHTAIAMGFAVNETADILASLEIGSFAIECPYGASFTEFSQIGKRNQAIALLLIKLSDFYNQLVKSLPEGGSALVVNHSGMVEYSTVACLPNSDLDHLGDGIRYCEGVRITWENGMFTHAEIIRV